MEIVFYHWWIIGGIFWLLDYFKIGGISAAVAFAGVVQGFMSYFQPELAWGWQVWGFVMLLAISAIFHLTQTAGKSRSVDKAERKLEESTVAETLQGTRVTLTQPLYPGSSKLEVKGRFWKVNANRDFPAGTVVEVAGHRGNTLMIVSAESSSYGEKTTRPSDSLSLDVYHREEQIEAEYGEPDFGYWVLFQEALQDHSKLALVYAYHVLCGLKLMTLEEARVNLNTYTLALYDTTREGQYLTLQKQMYSQPRIYNFLYMDGRWTGKESNKFDEEINNLIAALHSEWAERFRGEIEAATALRTVMMIREQQAVAN